MKFLKWLGLLIFIGIGYLLFSWIGAVLSIIISAILLAMFDDDIYAKYE